MRIPIHYDRPWRALLSALLLPAHEAYVAVDGDRVRVHMSWAFATHFTRADVEGVSEGPAPVVSVGVHGWRGRWLVNGARRPIATVRLRRSVRAYVCGFPVRLHELLVSVDDVDALRHALCD